MGILNIRTFSNKKNFKFKNKKIYSIYYWNNKKSKSANYYYPQVDKESHNKIFISSFADSKYFSFGLIHSILNSRFITPATVLNTKELILSILQFLHLFLHDISSIFFKKNYNFLSFWIGWKKGSEIFYSILIYNSIIKLSRYSSNCEFISWYENQVTNKSFSLGVGYSKKIFHLIVLCQLITVLSSRRKLKSICFLFIQNLKLDYGETNITCKIKGRKKK